MNGIPDLSQPNSLAIIGSVIIVTVFISYLAYLLSIKGIYNETPEIKASFSSFMMELVAMILISIASGALFKAFEGDVNQVERGNISPLWGVLLLLVFFLSLKVKSYTVGRFAGEAPGFLQSFSLLVMHGVFLYIIAMIVILAFALFTGFGKGMDILMQQGAAP